jgi:4-hydroxy-3-polyprenylbenzoate decarboxylase
MAERIDKRAKKIYPVVVGISGASGSILAQRAIEALLHRDIPVIATCSTAARMVWQEEMEESFGSALARWQESANFTYCPIGDLKSPIASGTTRTAGMMVIPCSTASLAAIAHGLSSNLLQRAADVCIKEGQKLVLVPRETPLSPIHLENMLTLARLGVVVLPPEPAFYLHPTSVEDIVDYIVAKAITALGLPDFMDGGLRYQRRSE